MVTLSFVFWLFVILFAVIGGLRGWAKELLVTFSVILAIFIITVLENHVAFVNQFIAQYGMEAEFWTRAGTVVLMTFFGYQTTHIPALAKGGKRELLRDAVLGVILGAFNGYLVVGSVWFYLDKIGYAFDAVQAPTAETAGQYMMAMVSDYLPPELLGVPGIYFAIAIAFTFIVIAFV